MSYSLTVLLSIAVFMTIVGDTLPRTSEPTPLISYLLLVSFVISSLVSFVISSLITVITVLYFAYTTRRKVNRFQTGWLRYRILLSCLNAKKIDVETIRYRTLV